MLAMKSAARSSDATAKPVNLRIREETRLLIDRAARAQGRSRSVFMIEAARRAAVEDILDLAFFLLDSQDYDAFLSILDKDAEGEAAAKLMAAPKPWAK